jgi:hypothetical protein
MVNTSNQGAHHKGKAFKNQAKVVAFFLKAKAAYFLAHG